MRLTLALLALIVAAVMPRQAAAFDLETALKEQHVQYQGEPDYRVAQSGCLSLSQAVAQVRARTKGEVVGAETRIQGGREVHHIKVLTKDGKVKTYRVNGCRR